MRATKFLTLIGLLVIAGCSFPFSDPGIPTPWPTATALADSEPTRGPATASPTSQPTPIPTSTPAPAKHPIQIRTVGDRAEFYDARTGESFTPRGANYFWIIQAGGGLEDRFFEVGTFDPERVAADFELLLGNGFNTVRIFLDSCSSGLNCAGNPNGPGLNPPYLDNIAATMQLAKEAGIFLLLTSNDLPAQGGYWALVDSAVSDQFGPYRNAHYLTASGVEAGRAYWRDLMSGLAARDAPFEAVLGWSLLNEQWYFYSDPPFSLDSGLVTTANGETYDLSDPGQHRQMAVDGMRLYIQALREVILEYDPNGLVTMGFFVPDYPNPIREGDFRYVETAPLLESAALDFFDFHGYPGQDSFAPLAENFGMVGYEAKPVILGEVGAFIDRYASVGSAVRAVQSWIGEACQAGFDGFLYWGLYRAPEAIGDATWGFIDANGEMMAGLSTAGLPDPCDPALLPPENLALGKAVRASRLLPAEPPEFAVDGQPTQWGAGADAPQWVEIDLGVPQNIGLLRLVVAQFPAGQTTHQVLGAGPGEALRLLHQFIGHTQEGEVLEFAPEGPWEGIQILRIITTQSPSWVAWREVEVFGVP